MRRWLLLALGACGPLAPVPHDMTQPGTPPRARPAAIVDDAEAAPPAASMRKPMVAVSQDDACYLDGKGRVFCWGRHYGGTATRVAAISDAIQVGVGMKNACALGAGGDVACWGDAEIHIAGDAWTDIAMGWDMLCLLDRDRSVWCRGQWRGEELERIDGLAAARDIDAGQDAYCALTMGGRIQCWGRDRTLLEIPDLGDDNVEVHAGFRPGGCALSRAGKIRCFRRKNEPVKELAFNDARGFDVGFDQLCAFDTTGGMFCWQGERPDQIGGGVAAVGVGHASSCFVKQAGGVACWGNGEHGELGNGARGQTDDPTKVAGLEPMRQVSSSPSESCGVAASGGAVLCWGGGEHVPRIEKLPPAVHVTGAEGRVCVALQDGTLRCREERSSSVPNPPWRTLPKMSAVQAMADVPSAMDGAPPALIVLHRGGRLSAAIDGEVIALEGLRGEQVSADVERICALWQRKRSCFRRAELYSAHEQKKRRFRPSVRRDTEQVDKLQDAPPPPRSAAKLVQHDHQCGVDQAGGVHCWGLNDQGQVGIPVGHLAAQPVDVIFSPER